MTNKIESINGRLLQYFGKWKVQSSYGTFELSEKLQSKPDVSSNGAWVAASVKLGEVVDYHFSDESV